MLRSWGISQIFLSGVPPFPSPVAVNRLPKGYIAPSWHVKFWPSPGKFGPKSLFYTLRVRKVWVLG